MDVVIEEERRAEQAELGAELTDVAECDERHVERAHAQPLELLGRIAERRRGEDADAHGASCRVVHACGEPVHRQVVRMAVDLVVAEPQVVPGRRFRAGGGERYAGSMSSARIVLLFSGMRG